LIANGHQVHIVTASSWPGAESYMNKSGAEFHILRNKEEIPFRYDVAIGDSAWDIPMLKKARYMFCPKDAQSEVRFLKDINILETKGGDGVMAEIVEIFIL
jgi:3-deoxy-D-manno-octulosonate 8-phosphate phosphatase KdsC-like HAD superfamily phosphatase